MKVLVFGGSGFLGSHVADVLTEKGYEVTIFDIRRSPYLMAGQKMIVGDILDENAVEKAIAGKDFVYHFAGVSDIRDSFDNPKRAARHNILGTLNLLESCKKFNIKRFVFASTVYVCSKSGSIYRTTKKACEDLIYDYHRAFGLSYVILRYGSLYGIRSKKNNSIYNMLHQAIERGAINNFYANLDDERKYIHVRDAAKLSVKMLGEEYKDQNYILTGRDSIKISKLYDIVNYIAGGKIKINYTYPDTNLHYSKHYDDKLHPIAGKELHIEDDDDFSEKLFKFAEKLKILKEQR